MRQDAGSTLCSPRLPLWGEPEPEIRKKTCQNLHRETSVMEGGTEAVQALGVIKRSEKQKVRRVITVGRISVLFG